MHGASRSADPGSPVTWVVSACAYARQGMAAAVAAYHWSARPVVECFSGQEAPPVLMSALRRAPPAVVAVYLSVTAEQQQSVVRLLAAVIRDSAVLPELVVFCDHPAEWVYPALLHLSGNAAITERLRVADARLTVQGVGRLLSDPDSLPLLHAGITRSVSSAASAPLSEREWLTLQMSLAGVSMAELGRQMGVSKKTLYIHRYHAMQKLGGGRCRGRRWLWHLARLACGECTDVQASLPGAGIQTGNKGITP